MKPQNKKAYDAIIRARTVLLVSNPFFGCLALHLDLVEDEKGRVCRTMAVDGVSMYYYPDFVLGLSEAELIGVVAHEVLHCALQHMTRCQHRNHVIFNMAGDYVINDDLLTAGFTLPAKRLYDPKYKNMSTEEVYERIRDDVQKQLNKQKGKKGQKGQQGDGAGGMVIDGTDLDTEGLDPGGCGGVMDAGGRQGDKAKADEVGRDWDANVRMAVNVAKRANAGTVPGYLERLVRQLTAPKISWRELTRQFIDTSMSKDYSWSRPNRRHVYNGLHLPGFISDALHHLVMFIDVSGSVDEKMMQAMVSEGAGALNDHTADKLTIVYVDTDVRKVDEWVPGDLVTCSTVGGGGTDFASAMQWVKKTCPDAACIIFLTDMMTSSFGEDPGIPTLWGAYLPAVQLATVKVPFGNVIAVDTAE
jgi:predicted metal-dependent peptidase